MIALPRPADSHFRLMDERVKFIVAFLLFFAVCAPAMAEPDFKRPGDAVCKAAAIIEAAYFAGDLNALDVSAQEAATRVTPYWAEYLTGLAEYRRALMVMNSEKKQAKKALNRAIDTLKALEKREPHPEVLALLSTAYGLRIGLSPLKGMSLGSKANRAIAAALEAAPENPRVLLMDGIGKFNKPGMFGGDKDKAQVLFRRAFEAFETESSSPCWGRTSAMLWLARAELHSGNRRNAEALVQRLLTTYPDFAEAAALQELVAEK